MRGYLCGALAVGALVACGGTVRADDRAEALKIVDAAITAAGGEAKLAKLKIVSMKGKGTVDEGGQGGTFTIDGTVQGLDRLRMNLEMSVMDRTKKVLFGLNGDKAWAKDEERVEDLPAEVVQIIKAEVHALRLTQTLTSLKDKDLKLSPLGEMKIADRAAVGIKIARKDQPDVDLYFDKETHLPAKCELRVKEPNGMEVTTAWHFSNYKEVAGVKHPTKISLGRDDTKMMEMEISEVKPQDKVDEKEFAKPE
jgi:hypothetical protein